MGWLRGLMAAHSGVSHLLLQWRQPQAFAQAGLARVELLNADASQGYAFDARGDVCARMGQMGQNYRGLITQHTSACTAQSCPPQR